MLISAQHHVRPTRTQTRWPRLKQLFPAGSETDTNARLARLCVLFEDLRIELIGADLLAPAAAAESALDSHFDLAGSSLRRIYFLRRSIGTCCEFAEAMRLLDETAGFRPIRTGFGTLPGETWSDSVKYFKRHDRFWKEIRNDVGGHFGEKAARFAVENLPSDAFGLIESQWDDRTQNGGCILGFSSEIAATAMLRHLPGSAPEEQIKSLFDRLWDAYSNAILAVECLVIEHLWPRSET